MICRCVPGTLVSNGSLPLPLFNPTQMDIFWLGDIKVIPLVFFLRDGVHDQLDWEDTFGNLARVLPVLGENSGINEGKCCYQMQRRWTWRCWCHQVQIYGRDLECLQAMSLLGKRQGHQMTPCYNYGALQLHDQRGKVFFASLSSKRLCWQIVGNSEIQRGIFVWVREIPRRSCGNEDCCKLKID